MPSNFTVDMSLTIMQTWSLQVCRTVLVSSPTALFAPLVEIGVMFSLNLWNVRIGDQRTMPPLFIQGVFWLKRLILYVHCGKLCISVYLF